MAEKFMEQIVAQGRCLLEVHRRERIFNGVNLVYPNNAGPDTGRKPVRSDIPTWKPYEAQADIVTRLST